MTEPMTWISPGDWTAMSNEGVWVLADTSQDQQLVTDLWKAASTHGITADQVLSGMLSHGFDNLRGLVIAATIDDGLRLIVRHPATAQLENDHESESVIAQPGTTWVDVTRPRPQQLILTTDGTIHDGLELPLALGASTAKSVRVEFAAPAAPEVEPEVNESQEEQPGDATAFMSLDEILAEGEEPGAEHSTPAPPLGAPEAAPEPVSELTGPTVFAVRCSQGHLSSPMRTTCRVCGITIPEQKPLEVETPPLGVIVVPSGDRIPVDQGIVIGRSPLATPGTTQETIAIGFSGEISRQHAEITVEGWNVYVRDLNTTNGTSVTAPDRVTVQLRSGENYLVEPGSEIDLADAVTFRFEALS